jgi:hypothetical protein
MVNDMLDVNKLEAGKMEFFYEEIDVSRVVDDNVVEM